MITGTDLVEWQLRVASGEPLPQRQEELAISGHAIEARIYAEDPARDFLPATGVLRHLRAPPQGAGVRVDTGVRAGDAVSIHYDPMIAKLVVWGEDRGAALRRLREALAGYEIAGLATNLGFLACLAAHPDYAAGRIDTGFIARHRSQLLPEAEPISGWILAAATAALLLDQAAAARGQAERSGDKYSPWHRRDGWRLNGDTYQDLAFLEGERRYAVRVHYRRDGFRLDLPELDRSGASIAIQAAWSADGALSLALDGVQRALRVMRQGDEITVLDEGRARRLVLVDRLAPPLEEEIVGGHLAAPMAGRIVQVLTMPGAAVRRGQALVVLEAMKMEHTIAAPADGIVEHIAYTVGDLVEEGAELLVLGVGTDGADPGGKGG